MNNEEQKKDMPTNVNKRNMRNFYLLIVPVLIIAVLGSFAGGIFWASQQSISEEVVEEDVGAVPVCLPGEECEEEIVVAEDVLETTSEEEEPDLEILTGEHAINIDFLAQDEQVEQKINQTLKDIVYTDWLISQESSLNPVAYVLGTVNGGVYDDYTFTLEIIEVPGMGMSYQHYYLLSDESGEGVPIILDRYATSSNGPFSSPVNSRNARDVIGKTQLAKVGDRVKFDSGAIVVEFEDANLVRDIEGREYVLQGIGDRIDYPEIFDYSAHEIVTTLENGSPLRLITDPDATPFDYQFFALRSDNRIVLYDAVIPFWPKEAVNSAIPTISWSNGNWSRYEYMKGSIGGCGYQNILNVVDKDEIGDLKEIGSYSKDGIKHSVFGPLDLSAERYEYSFDNWQRYDETRTFEEFEALRPFFYYQDIYGRWIEFQNVEIVPAGECGKPVIYLYPEETMDIEVKLDPVGGFTVTEPAYNDGWSVTASPNGQLLNHGDDEVYPYLFWEGRGALYSAPEFYWVVAREDVHNFLIDTLAEIGLNYQETYDFMEFWEPRMQDSPWYKIGFHGTEVMDLIAPMELSESPDSVLRILMDYSELSEPIEANPPMIPQPPERDGFTVIEWGGVIR